MNLAKAKLNFPDADFWVQRRGARNNIGKVSKEFNRENIGIKVLRLDELDPGYLYYWMEHVQSQNWWERMGIPGVTGIWHLRVRDVQSLLNRLHPGIRADRLEEKKEERDAKKRRATYGC